MSFTRPGLFFGVSVAPEFSHSAEGRKLLLYFRTGVWCATAVSIGAALIPLPPLFVLAIFFVGTGFSLVPAYRAAQRHRIDHSIAVEIDIGASPERIPGGV